MDSACDWTAPLQCQSPVTVRGRPRPGPQSTVKGPAAARSGPARQCRAAPLELPGPPVLVKSFRVQVVESDDHYPGAHTVPYRTVVPSFNGC
eukprot:765147-Hanusia_phi.AAC.3